MPDILNKLKTYFDQIVPEFFVKTLVENKTSFYICSNKPLPLSIMTRIRSGVLFYSLSYFEIIR